MEANEVTPMHSKQEKEMNTKIINAARKIEDVWRIKSRHMCLKVGYNNFDYFHKQIKV